MHQWFRHFFTDIQPNGRVTHRAGLSLALGVLHQWENCNEMYRWNIRYEYI